LWTMHNKSRAAWETYRADMEEGPADTQETLSLRNEVAVLKQKNEQLKEELEELQAFNGESSSLSLGVFKSLRPCALTSATKYSILMHFLRIEQRS